MAILIVAVFPSRLSRYNPERRVAIINDEGREIGTVPMYSKPSYENPAR
jgi:hypothetical protein